MQYTASHSIVCNAPRARVYELISRSSEWPAIFEPCESVTVLADGDGFEHIEITARVNGTPMSWQSRRHFLPEVFGIESTLVRPMKLVRAMNTSWRVAPINSEQCLLILEHDYDLDDEIAGQVEGVTTLREAECFIDSAIDANSRTELGNIKQAVERPAAAQSVALDRSASHSVVCAAPADSVYAVIRDTANWPRIFDACLSATRIEAEGNAELVRIEAMQDGQRVAWNTQRRYFDAIHRIDYHLPVPMPFLESMQGQWRVVPLTAGRCLLTVNRSWRLLSDVRGIREGVDTVAQASAIVDKFVNENAQAEMHAIRAFVEGRGDAFMSFATTHRLPYAPDAVYAVLADAAQWPDVLPHCESLQMVYDDAQYQEFLMRVRTPRGIETFRSIRRCNPDELSIHYFQPEPPAVLRTHHGSWQVRSAPGGAEVIGQHSIQLDGDACVAAFGEVDTLAHKRRIKELVVANSGTTIEACTRWLEASEAFHE
jgi:ribosome-associated toxin RatA of RatAB toxin-antitoxin module